MKPVQDHPGPRHEAGPHPPGRLNIMEALTSLLREKEFSAITWADIAQRAGVTEGLIYKYFKDKRNLLHLVLKESLDSFYVRLTRDLKGIEGALNKLRKLVWSSISMYAEDRVFARILLVEVQTFPGYFESETYQVVRDYSRLILDIIKEGVKSGEIRDDISPPLIREVILGGIEHLCLPGVFFDRETSPDLLTKALCDTVFGGIAKR